MRDVCAREERTIRELTRQLEEEDRKCMERVARGEPADARRYMDLKREIRRRQREVARAYRYLEQAERNKQ